MKLRQYTIIKSPHVSEKSANVAEKFRQYVFKVDKTATKPEIKSAVENLFGVKVLKVNTLIQKGKRKAFRGKMGRRSDVKKAIVTLAEGQEIDFIGAE